MSERRIAFLCAGCMLSGHPDRREDAYEHDLEFGALRAGGLRHGLRFEEVVWDHAAVDPAAFDAFVVGTTWDYVDRTEAFLTALARFSRHAPVLNGLNLIRWNLDKSYLLELQSAEVRTVPTMRVERPDERLVREGHDRFGADRLIAKPIVGACAWRQVRVDRDGPWPARDELPPGVCLVQPYLDAVSEEGEVSVVVIGGEISHALRKIPAAGDYRTQSVFGAREVAHEPDAAERRAVADLLERLPERPLYARVDFVRDAERMPCLMELELIEPYLYPEQGPDLGDRFARALVRTLDGHPDAPSGGIPR